MIKDLFKLYFKALSEAPKNMETAIKMNEEKRKEFEKKSKESK